MGTAEQGLWRWSPVGLVHRPLLCPSPFILLTPFQDQTFLMMTVWFSSNSRTSGRQSESEFPGECSRVLTRIPGDSEDQTVAHIPDSGWAMYLWMETAVLCESLHPGVNTAVLLPSPLCAGT